MRNEERLVRLLAGSREFLCGLLSASLVLAAALCWAPPASARPGNPVNLILSECTGYPREGSGREFLDPPAVCVTFTNTAPERVRYEYEFSVNDVLTSTHGLTAYCRVTPMVCTPATSALSGQGYLTTEADERRPNWGETGFYLANLDYDTRYCMRVRTRDEDDMVSLLWSNWACIRSRARPAAPSTPVVTVTASPRGDRVSVAWHGGGDVGYYSVEGRTSRPISLGLVPESFADAERNRQRPSQNGFPLDIPWGVAAEMQGEAYYYRVCAVNVIRSACSEWVSSLGDQLPRSERLQQGTHGETPQIPAPPPFTPRRLPPMDPVVTSAPGACLSGFVWRQARPADAVCVTLQSRSIIANENATNAQRVNPSGAYGQATCISGYVWREAYEGDVVCVTPQRRQEVRDENARAASRVAR